MQDGGRLPRRGWLELTLVGALALIAIALPLELVARRLFTESPLESRGCLIMNDPATGVRGVPNSVCRVKTYESKWVEFKYNSCGHRTAIECGPKPPGVFRIVMIGSSVAEGFTVSYDQSIGGLLPALLSRQTGRKVELYSEGMAWGSPHSVLLRFNEALAQDPDLILWPMTPWDIANVGLVLPPKGSPASVAATPWQRFVAALTRKRDIAGFLTTNSRAFFMIQHLLYESNSIYLAHSISGTDQYTASMQDMPAQEWQDKLNEYDGYVAQMVDRAKAAKVPFAIVALPRHAQAVMIAANVSPPGLNPYSFGDQLKAIADRTGAIYVDVLHELRHTPGINSAFYPIDQHLTIAGQEVLAEAIAKGLTGGAIAALSAHPQQRTAGEVAE